jgi:hypothetical protein
LNLRVNKAKYIDKSHIVQERFRWLSGQAYTKHSTSLKIPMGKMNDGKTIGTISLFDC